MVTEERREGTMLRTVSAHASLLLTYSIDSETCETILVTLLDVSAMH